MTCRLSPSRPSFVLTAAFHPTCSSSVVFCVLPCPIRRILVRTTCILSHMLVLTDERWWSDFTNFDKDDQKFFQEYLQGELEVEGEGEGSPRLTLRPFMRVSE